MAGGLIQIVSYGAQDIYLTGTPEITFFKVVYRRHTNFAMESVKVPFDNTVGFGETSSLIIPSVGDLMYKTYIEIILPEIDLKRSKRKKIPDTEIKKAEAEYKIVTDFMRINRLAYVEAHDVYLADNCHDVCNLINAVNFIYEDKDNEEIINKFKCLLTENACLFNYNEISLYELTCADTKDKIMAEYNVAINKSIQVQKFYFDKLKEAKNKYKTDQNENILFAWVERIGHSLIEEVVLYIGGEKIDKQYGDWLNIWYELSANRHMQKTYMEMIGNVKKLTTLNRKKKPRYVLTVPLQFWFCRFSGLALPLVALEYHDVKLEVKFRKMEEVSYIGKNERIRYSNSEDDLFLDEVSSEMNININACVLIDYIYLDGPERRRFAQSCHEYLIDQIQLLEMNEVSQNHVFFALDNFVHPSREIIWVSQKVRYTENLDGYTQTRWNNYSLTDENIGNPILCSSIDFHSYNRVLKLDGDYFNYVQPYQHHNTTPSDGINSYSFALFPEEHQPSGSANFSRLSRATLHMWFGYDVINTCENKDGPKTCAKCELFNIRVYNRNMNVLRFANGLAGLAFVY